MKTVALLLSTLLLAIMVPADAAPLNKYDECADHVFLADEEGQSCLRYALTGRGLPEQVTNVLGPNLFVWMAEQEGNGAKNVANQPSTLGTLFADSNGIFGLQRAEEFIFGKYRLADSALLI